MSYKRVIAVFALPLALAYFAFRLEIGPPAPSRVDPIDRTPFGSSNEEPDTGQSATSPDGRHLIFPGRADQTGYFVIHKDLRTGKSETILLPKEFGFRHGQLVFIEHGIIYPQLVFSDDSRRILIELFGELTEYDLAKHGFVGNFELMARPIQVFFDSTGAPKAITGYDGNFGIWQQWDVRSNIKDFDLVRSEAMIKQFARLHGDNPIFAIGPDCFAYCQLGLGSIAVNSLQDGSLLHEFNTASNRPYMLRLSPNGRYLSYSYYGEQAPDLSWGRWSIPNAWISRFLPTPSWRLAVIDLHTGTGYSGLNGNERSSGAENFFFNEDCSKLVSLTNEMRYEYELPLRGKRLPPGILAPLVVCVVLLPCLWMWRNKRFLSRSKKSSMPSARQRAN